jgi:hypothetical protein
MTIATSILADRALRVPPESFLLHYSKSAYPRIAPPPCELAQELSLQSRK